MKRISENNVTARILCINILIQFKENACIEIFRIE